MEDLLTFGQMPSVHAQLAPARLGARDLERSMSFAVWNQRACRLANGLLGLGLAKGDRVAVLAHNCLEWAEIYVAAAKAGLVAAPINFRLTGPEARFIVNDAEASAVIVQDELAGLVEEIRRDLAIPDARLIHFGAGRCPAGLVDYEALIAGASDREPDVVVDPADPWFLMYASGTTGRRKGAIRSHRSQALMSLCAEVELGVHRNDTALLVMPMCHANPLNIFGAFNYCGGAANIYSRKSFDPEHFVRALSEEGATFTSLVPTHYVMMLGLPAETRARYDVGRVTTLMVSSAPARQDMKRAVMELFRNSGLFEPYGSTETGWVTMLHPREHFTKLGSVGRECVGSWPVRLLDEAKNEVPDGEAGELYSSTPCMFDGYWRLPEKTREAFHGAYCMVGDMARRDADGYINLVDRKSNMIISGGENVYPSEVEAALGSHPSVRDVAVVGLPDAKWSERVHAVVVLHETAGDRAAELTEWVRGRLAGYKRPRSFSFVREEEVPRNATGKALYRQLKAKLAEAERVGPA